MKLSFWTIIIMAISLSVGILAFVIFQQTMPTLAATKNYETYKEQLQTEAAKEKQAEQRVVKATALVKQKTSIWNGFVATRTPEPGVERGGINLGVNPFQLAVDTEKFRNSVQRAIDIQVKKGGVRVVNAPFVPGPGNTDQPQTLLSSYYNYPGVKFPVVFFDFGTVTVEGTYDQIMANVRSYKSMPHYLAVADALQITGTSPNLTGTYTLSIVGFIRGKDIFPPVPVGAAPGGAATGAPRAAGLPGQSPARGGA